MTGDAWPEWHDVLVRRWYAMARRTLGVRDADVDDVVQETVSRVLQRHRAAPFPSPDDAARWGATVLANLVRGSWRTAHRHPSVPLHCVSERALGTARAADEVAVDRELTVTLARLVGTLPPADQAILRARFADELSYADAAAHLGIGVSAYGVRLHRLVRGLRDRLSPAGVAVVLFLPRARRHLTRPAVAAAPALAVVLCLAAATSLPLVETEAGRGQVGGPSSVPSGDAGSSASAGSGDPARPLPRRPAPAPVSSDSDHGTPPVSAPPLIEVPVQDIADDANGGICLNGWCTEADAGPTVQTVTTGVRDVVMETAEEATVEVEQPPLPLP